MRAPAPGPASHYGAVTGRLAAAPGAPWVPQAGGRWHLPDEVRPGCQSVSQPEAQGLARAWETGPWRQEPHCYRELWSSKGSPWNLSMWKEMELQGHLCKCLSCRESNLSPLA